MKCRGILFRVFIKQLHTGGATKIYSLSVVISKMSDLFGFHCINCVPCHRADSHMIRGNICDLCIVMVFVFVVVYTTLQAPTLGWVARKLGVTTGDDAVDIEVEVAPLDKIQADFMQIKVPAGSQLHGVTIFELRLPPSTVVSLIIRDGTPFAPGAAGGGGGRWPQ